MTSWLSEQQRSEVHPLLGLPIYVYTPGVATFTVRGRQVEARLESNYTWLLVRCLRIISIMGDGDDLKGTVLPRSE